MIHTFNKENGIWYIDLPEFLAAGLGSKGNLMMVAGADTLLDKLAGNKTTIKIEFDEKPFKGYALTLVNIGFGMDEQYLESVGHPKVEYGGYYNAVELNHDLWLCPVCQYLFNGKYPARIYVKIAK